MKMKIPKDYGIWHFDDCFFIRIPSSGVEGKYHKITKDQANELVGYHNCRWLKTDNVFNFSRTKE